MRLRQECATIISTVLFGVRTLLIRLKALGHKIDFNYSDKNGQIQA
jgi:hypothetical protein